MSVSQRIYNIKIGIVVLVLCIFSGLSVFLLFFPSPALAEKIGNVDFKLSAAIEESYDNNITFARDDEKEDISTKLSLGGVAKYEGRLMNLSLSGNLSRQTFDEYSGFNNTSGDVNVVFNSELSKYDRINLENSFSHAEEPRSFDDQFGASDGRYSFYKNKFGFVYSRDISRQLLANIKYSFDKDLYSRSDLRDSFMNGTGAGVEYALSSATIFLLSYDFYKRKFDTGSSASANSVIGGLRQYLTSRLYVDFQSGAEFLKAHTGNKYTKPVFIVSLIEDIDENTRTRLIFTKQYYSKSYSQDFFDYWQVSGNFSRRLLERLKGYVFGFYGEGEYTLVSIKDKLQGASFGLIYELSENISGTMNYSYSQTDSSLSTRDYDRNTVSIGMKVEF